NLTAWRKKPQHFRWIFETYHRLNFSRSVSDRTTSNGSDAAGNVMVPLFDRWEAGKSNDYEVVAPFLHWDAVGR
ncbi:MAG TPA: hypothetical protein VMT58_06035, partial [Candidatus Binataceae bacterium]|nr:hypothetical protein [Candidatus Binataceae bacterium]